MTPNHNLESSIKALVTLCSDDFLYKTRSLFAALPKSKGRDKSMSDEKRRAAATTALQAYRMIRGEASTVRNLITDLLHYVEDPDSPEPLMRDYLDGFQEALHDKRLSVAVTRLRGAQRAAKQIVSDAEDLVDKLEAMVDANVDYPRDPRSIK